MSTNYINIGTINNDHHREMTVNVPAGTNVSELVRAFFSNNAEDVQAEECTDAKNAAVHPQQPLPFFVSEKLQELELYTVEQFAMKYREAVEDDAHALAEFLHKYEKMGVLNFKGYDKKEIYTTLRDFFPTMKEYSYTNFIYYF